MFAEWDTSTKWCCDQDVEGCARRNLHKKNVRSVLFVVKRRDVVAGGVALNAWFTTKGMCAKNNNMQTWRDQAIIEWFRRVIVIVACCHSAKPCAHAAQAFPIATQPNECEKCYCMIGNNGLHLTFLKTSCSVGLARWFPAKLHNSKSVWWHFLD